MGQAAASFSVPSVGRQALRQLEKHFVASTIYRRPDVAERQASLARAVSSQIIPRLLRLHAEVVPDAPPVALMIEHLRRAARTSAGWPTSCWALTWRPLPPM